jgi:hypothetical protein
METQTIKSTRPTFLTVLCIISFVGLGYSIFKGLFALAFSKLGASFYSLIQSNLENSLSQINTSDPHAARFVESIFESILKLVDALPLLATISIICSSIALAGVIMMWNLKRTGFYLYTCGKAILIFVPMILIGINFISLIAGISLFFIAAIFITLYALNLKAMK